MKKITIPKLYDPWKDLRPNLFGNKEINVYLEAITMPVTRSVVDGGLLAPGLSRIGEINSEFIEQIPALSAAISYGKRSKFLNLNEAKRLNKQLIKKKHKTPFEFVVFNFLLTGISKSAGAQLRTHRIGQGHIVSSRRFQEQGPAFVYPRLEYINKKSEAKDVYEMISYEMERDFLCYHELRKDLTKQDSRRIMSVQTAQTRVWSINCSALRHFLNLRLANDAEWEIRRLAIEIFNMVYPITPSIFEDIGEKFK